MPTIGWLPWLHRASPSTTLDKLSRLLKGTLGLLSIENEKRRVPKLTEDTRSLSEN
jgi:hypothetical protein